MMPDQEKKDKDQSQTFNQVNPIPGEQEDGLYYLNENGLVTFTKKYHLERGYCCSNGCRHCPFDYESVPEPKRTELLDKRNLNSGEIES